jgi:Tfp pilus assembly protein PilV
MCSFHVNRSLSKGVLLMEALVALLLFVSMTTIIGSYWHYLASIAHRTQERMQGLSIAREAVQRLIIDHEQIASPKQYNVAYDYTPLTIHADAVDNLPALSLVTITVTSLHNNTVVLQTLYAEHYNE